MLLGSPHADGVTDRLGRAAAIAAKARLLAVRDLSIQPCAGCGHCISSHDCVFSDDAPRVFAKLHAAASLIIAAPVYFYALPASLKALIDRSQVFWASGKRHFPVCRKAAVIMAAGRPAGEKLFSGSLLTFKWFLKPFGFEITDTLLLRGLDNIDSLEHHPEHMEAARKLGCHFAAPA